MDGPLAGIRVLDLTQGVTGPYVTKLFADYGATVTKVERPAVGDLSRRLGPFPGDEPHPERSGMFLELNTGKRSVTLDLHTASGQEIARRLAADVELVVESFRPGTLERMGLGPDVLRDVNPRASLVRISNFGQSGPYRDFEADDLLLYAMGGVLSVTAAPDREPVKIGLYAPLFLAGGTAAAFTLGAYMGQRRTGVGERVDFSIHEMLAASMDRGGPNLASYQYSGGLMFAAAGVTRTTALPAGVVPCMDGYISITVGPRWWDRLCRTIERPDLIDDPAYTERLMDITFAPEVDALLYPWLFSHTKREITELAQAQGLVVGGINTMADVLSDPQLAARGFWADLDHPGAGVVRLPGLPFRMMGTPGEVRPAPTLGQHNAEVLGALGYSATDLVRLRERGVI